MKPTEGDETPLRINAFTVIPKQKYRRSCRHLPPKKDDDGLESLHLQNSCGYFQIMPLEIFHKVLCYLSVSDISVLSMTSKVVSTLVVGYIATNSGITRLLLQGFHSTDISKKSLVIKHYRSLGLLFKRCTLLLPTKQRLKFAHNQLFKNPCFRIGGCTTLVECSGFACFGTLLQTLIAGWDELECNRVFNFLNETANLPRKMQSVVCSRPGATKKLELQVRLFYRRVLLDHWEHQHDTAFWLTRILKPWPIVNQARLLYLLYGPMFITDGGQIQWHQMTQIPANEESVKDLAVAVRLLHEHKKEWTADDIFTLLEELAGFPQEWLLENCARLLICCGNNMCFTFLANKAVNGRLNELATLIVFLSLVCEKDGYCMDWAVKMVQRICKVIANSESRWNFLQAIEKVYARVTIDMIESILFSGLEGDEGITYNMYNMVNAQAEFHKEIMLRAFNNVLT
ncbi:F-box only protein 47 [Callorhinchus milii]|uniref:F-box only protein 47 n=1 Tax=Callorhinchus milii TaxID=7868 RepID=UPI00045760EC|nr:F-box only protein 47 [Callorhinchus milii]|eukprot:gi/632986414/ref/XP_007910225.1/ PREDICTED: F-box only protein 47 [Callorhinchus milii]